LKVAGRNCLAHGVEDRVQLLRGDLLEFVPAQVDIIVANLPYVITDEVARVNTAGFEPRLALDGGADGMNVVTRLCVQAKEQLHPGGFLLLEIGLGQNQRTSDILQELYPVANIEIMSDLSGIARVVCLTLPPK
jgi:release factor glutamine methyltransferase